MSHAPLVIVTATTETLRDRSRVRVNEAYTNALAAFGVVPLVLPPIDCSLALDALGGASGLVLTGGEDVDPKHFGEGRHAATGPIHDGRDASSSRYRARRPSAACRRSQSAAVRRCSTSRLAARSFRISRRSSPRRQSTT